MKNNTILFTFLIILYFLITSLSNLTLFNDDLFFSLVGDNVEEILKTRKKIEYFGYFFIPIFFFVKILVIAAILDAGCFFFGKEIKYKKLFNIVVKAEFVFLLVIVFKTAWFYFFQTNYTLEDLQYFYPLSALNIIGYEGLQPWFIYPFQVLNLFELAYWVILAYLIGKELNENTDKGMSIVASSYGVSLLIWVVGVMFFTLNIT